MPPKRVKKKDVFGEASAKAEAAAAEVIVPCLHGDALQDSKYPQRRKLKDLPYREIIGSQISLFSDADRKKLSAVTVENPHMKTSPTTVDALMGPIVNCQVCKHCSAIDCPGHYGLINLSEKPSNPSYTRTVVMVLHSVCNGCSRLYVDYDTLKRKGIFKYQGLARLQKIEELSEKTAKCTCPYGENGEPRMINREGPPDIIDPESGELRPNCKPYNDAKPLSLKKGKQAANDDSLLPPPIYRACPQGEFYDKVAARESGIVRVRVKNGSNMLNKGDSDAAKSPNLIYSILNCISDEDAKVLGFTGGHPRDLIMKSILVVPNVARPYTTEAGKVNQSRLTASYDRLVSASKAESSKRQMATNQAMIILFRTGGNEGHCEERRNDSFRRMLQRKPGIPRSAMMGKRTDFNGRTVASPAPGLELDQIAIPYAWKRVLTRFERVHELNYDKMQQAFYAGTLVTICRKESGAVHRATRHTSPPMLGDLIERESQEGDQIMMNRHPTLHKYSMMCYRITFWNQNTIGIPLQITSPLNADFDGDELNTWALITDMAIADAHCMVGVTRNLLQTMRATPTMGMVMDTLTGAYLMTRRNEQLLDYELDWFREGLLAKEQMSTYEDRCLRAGVDSRSARAAVSSILPANFMYTRGSRFEEDPPMIIVHGIIISGYLCKSDIGTGANGIIHKMVLYHGSERTRQFMTDLAYIVGRYLSEYQFSTGIDDLSHLTLEDNGKFSNSATKVMEAVLEVMERTVESIGDPKRDPRLYKYREKKIVEAVNLANGAGLAIAKTFFTAGNKINSIGVMTERGAATKGSIGNMGQMIGMVGQQFFENRRYGETTAGGTRASAYDDPHDSNPGALGLVRSSLFNGVTAGELYNIQRSARVSLIMGSMETPKTGAAQRQMTETYKGVIINQGRSLVTATGRILAPSYNSGYDTTRMVKVDGIYQVANAKDIATQINGRRGWIDRKHMEQIKKNRTEIGTKKIKPIRRAPYTPKNVEYNPDRLTSFEMARLLGSRTTQINNGAPVRIKTSETEAFKIALEEYNQGAIELDVIRDMPGYGEVAIRPTIENIKILA